MTRFLRSKQDRAWLWYRADGKCERCGVPLDPGWHADHVVPWSVSERTVAEEMQALCARCNTEKGARMLRRHQRDFKDLFEEIRGGHRDGRTILAWVTPGGGKSTLPMIAAMVGIPVIADAVCVVTPRSNLADQMEDNFVDPFFRQLLGHTHKIRMSTNQEDPCRGLSGYVTTYQALVSDRRGVNRMEFDRKRYVLVLDEFHHLEEGGEFHRAVAPLVDRAAAVVLMTGTLERHKGKRIAYMPYRPTIEGRTVVDLDLVPHVKYGRQDALEDRAVVPLVFQHLDGDATWVDRGGQVVAPLPISLAGKKTGDALFTALRTEYARDLLDRCVRDWSGYRRIKPRSKLLVVAPNIPLANKYAGWMREMGVDRVEVATSEDTPRAKALLEQFRKGDLPAIVTVQMAYEGLDCKSITHVCCATHIRSRPWIEQMISRANRYDPDAGQWQSQRGFVYAPDDQEIVQIFEEISAEQEPFIRDGEEGEPSGGEEAVDRDSIVPIGSQGGRIRAANFEGDALDYAETEAILSALAKRGLEGLLSPIDALGLYRDLSDLSSSGPPMPRDESSMEVRPSKEEGRMLDDIEAHCRGWDHDHGEPFGTLNRIVYQQFGKSRTNMRSDELRSVWAWLVREYPRHRSA